MNEERQRIILYGDSVVLAGVQASLRASSHLQVITLGPPPASLADDLFAFRPNAVIFDLGSVSPDFPLVLLQQPDLVLIGIDPETHQALVWSGRQAEAVFASDLVEIVQSDNR